MNPSLRLLALAALLVPAQAQAKERSYTITSFDRIRVDGPYRVTLVTGVAPFARAEGSQGALDSVSIDVQGRTLIVRRKLAAHSSKSAPSGPVTIAAGTHELAAAWLAGPGGLSIDKVRGQSFNLAVSGSGAAAVGQLQVDKLDMSVSGSARVELAGTAETATLSARGPTDVDAAGLSAKSATITASGSTRLRLTATDTAKVDAKGLAAVELGGRPSCTLRPGNSAEVTGCR